MLSCLKRYMRNMLLKSHQGLDAPLTLLEVHHRGGHKEAMAAGSHPDGCNIKMWSTRIGLLNGLVCITCAGLFQALDVKGRE